MQYSFYPYINNFNEHDLKKYNKEYKTNYKFYICSNCKSWYYFENNDDLILLCLNCKSKLHKKVYK